MPVIRLSTRVAAPVERCFDLSRSVEAHLASLRDTGERVVDGVRAGLLGPGDSVTWRGRHFGVPWRLASRITAFDRPRHFRDSMVRGPFARFDHDHRFTPVPGGTLMEDVFDYDAPLGFLGDLAERLVLTRHLTRVLEARAAAIKAIAESDRWRAYTDA